MTPLAGELLEIVRDLATGVEIALRDVARWWREHEPLEW